MDDSAGRSIVIHLVGRIHQSAVYVVWANLRVLTAACSLSVSNYLTWQFVQYSAKYDRNYVTIGAQLALFALLVVHSSSVFSQLISDEQVSVNT